MTSTVDRTSRTLPGPTTTVATNTTSYSTVSVNFTQRPNKEMETPEHKTQNNALVPMHKALSTTWKLSENHAPHIHNAEIRQDSKTILFRGSKLENQHTRKTRGTLSWVYKPSNNPIVIGGGNPCWLYRSQDLRPTKTVQNVEMHIPPPKLKILPELPMPGTGLMVPASPSSA